MAEENSVEGTLARAGLNFVRIPKGEFIMGSKGDNELAGDDEKPQHILKFSYDYWVGRFPVSVADFRAFIQSTAYVTQAERDGWCWVWNDGEMKWEKTERANWAHPLGDRHVEEIIEYHPVARVCYYDAKAFCEWLNLNHFHELPKGYHFCLPSEAEWEKAARGPSGREWPWGNEFDPRFCNSRESGKIQTVENGTSSPEGDSEYGVADMSGNIWEWTITLWGSDRNIPSFGYPYLWHDGREKQSAGEEFYRIIRGGSYKDGMKTVRCACRDIDLPHYSLSNLGFRVFVTPLAKRENT